MAIDTPLHIPVTSLVRARRFYGKALGLDPYRGRTDSGSVQYVCQGRSVILQLSKRRRRPVDTQLRIEVADFAYEYQRLVAEGVKFCALPKERPDGGWNARICDPDGNVIRIIERPSANANSS